MFRVGWRVDRRTGRERPFRPRLGGCLLWFVILIIIIVVAAIYFGGFRKGTQTSAPQRPAPISLGLTSR